MPRRSLGAPRRPDDNKAVLLRLLRRRGRLSRAEMARRAGLSEASVSRLIRDLMERGLVEEEGLARSTGGRPAVRLRLSEQRRRSIGVEMHDWEIRLVESTLAGRLLNEERFRAASSAEETLEEIIVRLRDRLAAGAGRRFEGVGVCASGLVDSRAGVIERGHDPAWPRLRVRERLEAALGVPVFVENNVRAAAFAEYHYGGADVRDAHCLVFVKVDEGVGFAVMLEGALYYGQHMAAGEFGQMVIADRGGAERHDRPGCLENLASDGALCRRFDDLTGAPREGVAGFDVVVRAREIAESARGGDPAAVQAVQQTARFLGIGISNVVWGLDPDAVILDGAPAEVWNLTGPVLRDQFADGREFLNFRGLIVRPSTLAGDAAILGAAAMPFRTLFADDRGARAA